MKNLLFCLSILFLFMSSCSDNSSDIPIIIPNKDPEFSISREIVYFGEYHTYSDVLKPYYTKFSITQTNPHATVSQARLHAMEDSLNNSLEADKNEEHLFYLNNVGIEINGKATPMKMAVSLDKDKREKYMSLKRDGLIELWKKHNMLCLFAVFELAPDDFSVRMRTYTSAEYDDVSMYLWLSEKFLDDRFDALKYFQLKDKMPSEKPTSNVVHYYWAYDRFNDRTYLDDKGNSYKTKVVLKKLQDIDGFESAIPSYTDNTYFDMEQIYPIMQVYKGDELWFEGKIFHYSEEHEALEGGTDTILGFQANTKKDGLYWELCYEWVGHSRLNLRKLDFYKPTENDAFTEVETININIVKDEKEGHKGTGSFDDGKGKTFNFNAAY